MRLTADMAGERLDAFLARSELALSRSAAQKLMCQFIFRIAYCKYSKTVHLYTSAVTFRLIKS